MTHGIQWTAESLAEYRYTCRMKLWFEKDEASIIRPNAKYIIDMAKAIFDALPN